MFKTYAKSAGFSLVELLVVLSVTAVLAAIVYANFSDSRAIARDAERQANLRLVENALELYRQKYGRYPEACDNRVSVGSPNWAGQPGTAHECSGGSIEYIVGLWPEFIQVLPQDSRLNGANSGYVYAVNEAGDTYKFMALQTVETETLSNTEPHPFFRCGPNFDNRSIVADGLASYGFSQLRTLPSHNDIDMCERSPEDPDRTNRRFVGGSDIAGSYSACTTAAAYESTYAVSNGFAVQAALEDTSTRQDEDWQIEYYTERLRCQ